VEWLSDLIKHLTISRSVTGAIFVTALVMTIGSSFFPGVVPSLPAQWSPAAFAALIFSGSLLLFWSLGGIWGITARGIGAAFRARAASNLRGDEAVLLHELGRDPNCSLNLEYVNYARIGIPKLELLDTVHRLQNKGLVEFDGYLVSVTLAGQKRALDLQRSPPPTERTM
jgi:hypothetical protein